VARPRLNPEVEWVRREDGGWELRRSGRPVTDPSLLFALLLICPKCGAPARGVGFYRDKRGELKVVAYHRKGGVQHTWLVGPAAPLTLRAVAPILAEMEERRRAREEAPPLPFEAAAEGGGRVYVPARAVAKLGLEGAERVKVRAEVGGRQVEFESPLLRRRDRPGWRCRYIILPPELNLRKGAPVRVLEIKRI
jgi:hypothetical protein